MASILEGKFTAKGKKFGIVVSRFNELISNQLLAGAQDCLLRHDCKETEITFVWVPGSFEIPITVKKMAQSGNHDALICLGAVIRGDTPHFDYIASEVSKGIALVGLETGVPCVFGVLTTNTIEQALERAGTKAGNKGWDAALSAIEMVNLFEKL